MPVPQSGTASTPLPAAPKARAIPWHGRLEARVLICMTVVAGLALQFALVAADRIVTSHSIQRSAENLSAAQSVFHRLAQQRAEFAGAQLHLIAELPVFRANLDLGDRPTVGAMAEEYRRKLGAEFCIVTDARGQWLGQPGWPARVDPPQTLQDGLGAARAGRSYQGIMEVGGHLFLVACEPARFGEEVLGTLMAGYPLDDAAALQLARMTGCEVSFAAQRHLCASSLGKAGKAALAAGLAAPAGPPEQLGPSPSLEEWAGARYVGVTAALSTGTAAQNKGQLILLQAWQPTQLFLDQVKRALGGVLGLAFLLSLGGGLVSSRRITRPLRGMVSVAEAVAAGNWDCQAPEEGSSEVAVMAAAFNQMTASLRHWRHEAERHSERLAEALTQLQQAHQATLEALSRALDARDNETEGHSLRVTHYATRLGVHMDLDPDALSALRWGALLHDIGKIGVADAILHKPARLTPDEMREMQRHCALGLEIVRGIPYLERAADVIAYHHERYDGQGYPARVAREAIPLVARIFAVADTLDAMTSDRPYRRGGSFAEALGEIERHSGSQFDPQVVAALGGIIDELRQWRSEIQPPWGCPAALLDARVLHASI